MIIAWMRQNVWLGLEMRAWGLLDPRFHKGIVLGKKNSSGHHYRPSSGNHLSEMYTPVNPTVIQKNWGLPGYA